MHNLCLVWYLLEFLALYGRLSPESCLLNTFTLLSELLTWFCIDLDLPAAIAYLYTPQLAP